MNNLPPLEDLHLLCTVARNRSFIVTAKELGVSPAYVSKRIALLEKVLQVRLLHRTTRQVSLNEEGDTVFRWAQLILEDAQQMTEAISTTKMTPRGLLRISTSEGFDRANSVFFLIGGADKAQILKEVMTGRAIWSGCRAS